MTIINYLLNDIETGESLKVSRQDLADMTGLRVETVIREIKVLSDEFYNSKNSYPKINVYDPAIIWLGARVGDVIKITRISEIAGISIAYRLVI